MSQPSLAAALVAGSFALACTGVATADDTPFDGNQPLLCALSQIAECDPMNGCSSTTAEAINAPPFIRVDVGAKLLSGTRPGGDQVETKILERNDDGGKLILQGVENSRGWTMTIDRSSGHLSLTVTGRELAFAAFGHCTVP